ncbi:MAG: peptidoglycan-binding protein [Pseudomonadota bacterium]
MMGLFSFLRIDHTDQINLKKLNKLLPPATIRYWRTRWAFLRAIASALPDLETRYDINNPKRLTHFLAQTIFESNYLREKEESFKYSKRAGLTATFKAFQTNPERLNDLFGGSEKAIANFVYANKNGNGNEASGDGWLYRGRGLIQLTGRNNYRDIGHVIGRDLEGKPEIVANDPKVAVEAAAAFFKTRGVLPYADADDAAAVSAIINAGGPTRINSVNHLQQRLELTETLREVMATAQHYMVFDGNVEEADAEPALLNRGMAGPDVEALQQDLAYLGYLPGSEVDGVFGPKTMRAVKEFQSDYSAEYGLTIDGVVTQAVADAIDGEVSASPRSRRPQSDPTVSDLRHAGVRDPGERAAQGAGLAVTTGAATAAANETGLIDLQSDEDDDEEVDDNAPTEETDNAPQTEDSTPNPSVAAGTDSPNKAPPDQTDESKETPIIKTPLDAPVAPQDATQADTPSDTDSVTDSNDEVKADDQPKPDNAPITDELTEDILTEDPSPSPGAQPDAPATDQSTQNNPSVDNTSTDDTSEDNQADVDTTKPVDTEKTDQQKIVDQEEPNEDEELGEENDTSAPMTEDTNEIAEPASENPRPDATDTTAFRGGGSKTKSEIAEGGASEIGETTLPPSDACACELPTENAMQGDEHSIAVEVAGSTIATLPPPDRDGDVNYANLSADAVIGAIGIWIIARARERMRERLRAWRDGVLGR